MDRRAAEAEREVLDAATARRFSFVELPEPLKKEKAEMWKQMTMVVLLSGLMIFSGVGRSYAQLPYNYPPPGSDPNPPPPGSSAPPSFGALTEAENALNFEIMMGEDPLGPPCG